MPGGCERLLRRAELGEDPAGEEDPHVIAHPCCLMKVMADCSNRRGTACAIGSPVVNPVTVTSAVFATSPIPNNPSAIDPTTGLVLQLHLLATLSG